MIGQFLDRHAKGEYRLISRLNGRTMANWLREDSAGAGDVQMAVFLLTWLNFAGELGDDFGPAVTLRTLLEAAELAVLSLTAAARSPGEG